MNGLTDLVYAISTHPLASYGLGALFFSCFFVAFPIVVLCLNIIWNFIDDTEFSSYVPCWMEYIIAWVMGYTCSKDNYSRRYRWRTKTGCEVSCGDAYVTVTLLATFCLPFIIVLALKVPAIFISLVLATVVIFLARTGRRGVKVLQKHINDVNAHKGGDS